MAEEADQAAPAGARSRDRMRLFDAMVLDQRLEHVDVRIAWRLLQYFNAERGCAWPSVPTLAVEVGCSERQVRRSRQNLVDCGWFDFKERRGRAGAGFYSTNEYYPRFEAIQSGHRRPV